MSDPRIRDLERRALADPRDEQAWSRWRVALLRAASGQDPHIDEFQRLVRRIPILQARYQRIYDTVPNHIRNSSSRFSYVVGRIREADTRATKRARALAMKIDLTQVPTGTRLRYDLDHYRVFGVRYANLRHLDWAETGAPAVMGTSQCGHYDAIGGIRCQVLVPLARAPFCSTHALHWVQADRVPEGRVLCTAVLQAGGVLHRCALPPLLIGSSSCQGHTIGQGSRRQGPVDDPDDAECICGHARGDHGMDGACAHLGHGNDCGCIGFIDPLAMSRARSRRRQTGRQRREDRRNR